MNTYTVVAFFLDTNTTRVEVVQAETPRQAHLTKPDNRAYTVCAVFDGDITPAYVEAED